MIDEYLYKEKITHAYEKGIAYGQTAKEIIHPDFYLPDYLGPKKDVYIEYWGYNENNIQYTKTKKFKLNIYNENQITLICINENDTHEINTQLDRKLNKKNIKENQINFDNEE